MNFVAHTSSLFFRVHFFKYMMMTQKMVKRLCSPTNFIQPSRATSWHYHLSQQQPRFSPGYSPPPRRSGGRSRSRGGRNDRRDDRDRRPEPKKKSFEEKRIPPPAVRGPDKPQITEEQRANSVEYNGFYYAALDFTPPNQGGESAGQKTRIQMPYGWEVADITDDVRDAVVRLHTFGTDFVVGEAGKAFHTAKGSRPGALEMIWDYKSLGFARRSLAFLMLFVAAMARSVGEIVEFCDVLYSI